MGRGRGGGRRRQQGRKDAEQTPQTALQTGQADAAADDVDVYVGGDDGGGGFVVLLLLNFSFRVAEAAAEASTEAETEAAKPTHTSPSHFW